MHLLHTTKQDIYYFKNRLSGIFFIQEHLFVMYRENEIIYSIVSMPEMYFFQHQLQHLTSHF